MPRQAGRGTVQSGDMARWLTILCLACCASWPPAAFAQTATAAAAPADESRMRVSLGWEVRRDRHGYRFENPSRFDTAFNVPHFYEQDYDADNGWLVAGVRFSALGRRWETEAGVALWGLGVGDDYDTFFQPGNDILTYGTTAVTDLQSVRFAHRVELGRAAWLRARLGYAFRRDRARFRPSDTVTRRTNPPSETRFFNDDRETTISSVHDILFGAAAVLPTGSSARLGLAVDVAPVTLARLTTRLPDKYPGQDITGVARGLSLMPSLVYEATLGGFRLELRADYARTWPYSRANRFGRDWAGLSISLWPARRRPAIP